MTPPDPPPLCDVIQRLWLDLRLAQRRRFVREDATPTPLRPTVAEAPTVPQHLIPDPQLKE